MSRTTHFTDKYIDIPLSEGLIFTRDSGDQISTNIPHLAVHHSPEGYNFSYSGSGPADLALNIVEGVLIASGYSGSRTREKLFNGYHPFLQAWRLHQSFKSAFIAGLSQEPGEYRLDYPTVRDWIYDHLLPEPEPEPEAVETEASDPDFPDADRFDDHGRREGGHP